MHSPDLSQQNVEKLKELFPNCVTESKDENGKLISSIDFDLLKQELSDHVVEDPQERYRIDWPGKHQAMFIANAPIANTLRPAREESVDFDNTKNLFIEGDNLAALKLLQETYLNKVKMIYIDPPYNTGKDFIFKDDYAEDLATYLERSNQVDNEGNRLVANAETNGRFHSDWLSMMYPRLKLARNLLRDDGVIFISIDDNEQANLKRLCDEVFGEKNFLADLIWNLNGGAQAGHFTQSHQSIICYTKKKESLPYFDDFAGGFIRHGALKKISEVNPASEVSFKQGSISIEDNLTITFSDELGESEKEYVVKGQLNFIDGKLAEDVVIKAGWAMKNQLLSWLRGEETFDTKGQKIVKFYFNKQGILFYKKERKTIHPKTVLLASDVGGTKKGGEEILNIFNANLMSFPKPSTLIKFLIRTVSGRFNDIVLDFFAGSGTTAHAVMQLNAEDGGKRQCISVQLPELTKTDSDAYKAGYKNIAELSKERIRRAGKKIKEENPDADIDIGFRVLKVDTSNMENVYYLPDDTEQADLLTRVNNIKRDRTAEDLLFQVLLDWGVDLTLPIEKREISGKTVYFVDENALVACFDEGIDETFINDVAEIKPLRSVFRDSGFASDAVKINVTQIFKLISPDTDIRTI